jgi:homoserine kinase
MPRSDSVPSRRGPAKATALVPCSTSNLGPGFDTLGIALSLRNRVQVIRTDSKNGDVEIISPISDQARPGATRLIAGAAAEFFSRARQKPFGIQVHLSGNVPIARGLGSSVTVRLGVMAALDALTQANLGRQALFERVAQLEGHPDNAAPAVFGGFTAAAMIEGRARCVRLRVHPSFRFVTLIPPFEVPTEAARQLLPSRYDRADVVHNITRAALITAAFAEGDADALRGAFEDRIHQPYREKLIPQLSDVLRAGERAGAVGGWLSGSGSTIICLATGNAEAVAAAMARKLRRSEVHILRADASGYKVSAD